MGSCNVFIPFFNFTGVESLETAINYWEDALAAYQSTSGSGAALLTADEAEFCRSLERVLKVIWYRFPFDLAESISFPAQFRPPMSSKMRRNIYSCTNIPSCSKRMSQQTRPTQWATDPVLRLPILVPLTASRQQIPLFQRKAR